jgi:transcriptional regulator GlxA family with amidase domain
VPDHVISQVMPDPIDTLLVAGSPNAAATWPDPHVVDWLRRIAPATRRYGPVCAGAFLLAETGLLDGRRIPTHWAIAQPWRSGIRWSGWRRTRTTSVTEA